MYYRAHHHTNKQIKIVISGGLGDCLLTTPFIRYFKTVKNYEKLTCIVSDGAAELFEMNPYIDQLIPVKAADLFFWASPEKDSDIFSPYIDVDTPVKKQGQFVVPMEYVFNFNLSDVPVARQVANFYDLDIVHENPEIFISSDDEKWARDTMSVFDEKPVILINRESRLKEKDLSSTFCKEMGNNLKDDYGVIYIESDFLRFSGLETKIPLPGLRKSAALFKKCHCIITPDSFPGHLAAAVNTVAIVLFGPSNPKAFGHDQNINIRTSSCPPCADSTRRIECEKSKCLEDIPVETVIRQVRSLDIGGMG